MGGNVKTCTECGRAFKGAHLRCGRCQRTDRACAECGKTFKGTELRCRACRATERTCETCGGTFKGHTLCCAACRTSDRACTECGRIFRSHHSRCPACSRKVRTCETCGQVFKSHQRRCTACCVTERTCIDCGKTFKSAHLRCGVCWRNSLPAEVKQAQLASQRNARRARKVAAEVAGPVPPQVYQVIRASGPCVYCGQAAATVDHVRPLSRGGWEHESNLVPACGWCNISKGAKLLTDWCRADRVAYGVAHSAKIAAEWTRLTRAVAGHAHHLTQTALKREDVTLW